MRQSAATAWLMGAALLLAGCAGREVRSPAPAAIDTAAAASAEAARAQWLDAHQQWSLTGRVAVSKAGKGGSGRLEWTQAGDRFTVALSAPVTRQSWRLDGGGSEPARLEGLDGGPREGASAADVLQQATGWEIPVAQLPQWMRGRPAAGVAVDAHTVDSAGRLTELQQAGWTIRYLRWREPVGAVPALPARIEASRGDASVKLVIDDWIVPSAP